MQPAERCIQTVQEGLKTKWEGSVTILSLVAKLPKKVIPKNTFAGCHGDMAVRMREVLARPKIGVCAPLALSLSFKFQSFPWVQVQKRRLDFHV